MNAQFVKGTGMVFMDTTALFSMGWENWRPTIRTYPFRRADLVRQEHDGVQGGSTD